SFFFSGLETGFVSLDMIALEQEAKRSKSRAALLRFVRTPDKFLGTTLIGNNIANALLATISTYLVDSLHSFPLDARYTSLVIGTVVLIFGEIVPKAVFRDNADTLVHKLYPVIRVFYYLFRPFVAGVGLINQALRRVLNLEDQDRYDYLTKDDLSYLLSQTSTDSYNSPQMEMIEDALDFKELEARNVMVPRTDIVAIPDTATIDEVVELARAEGFTRYPVYRNSIDDIVGVLIIYDILKQECPAGTKAGDIIHEPFFAPESIDLDVLLKDMQRTRRSMAIIVDSFGGTAGIVTMEDILEEIVGEIEDEYDDDESEKDVEQVNQNTWIAAADVEIDRLADDYDIHLPEGDYETLAGLILDHLELIPHQGQFITIEPYRIQVLQATDKKIVKVKIHKKALEERT
ncbi:MAG TPA: hemolysin family protein, partial [Candidatus Cloacimonadota bacterium]|nr:hemolysin family protein [Candidatus Cloacimonadota bacterium]